MNSDLDSESASQGESSRLLGLGGGAHLEEQAEGESVIGCHVWS